MTTDFTDHTDKKFWAKTMLIRAIRVIRGKSLRRIDSQRSFSKVDLRQTLEGA